MQRTSRRRAIALGAATLAGATFAPLARANAFPTKPISFIVPGLPGGATDILARMLADDMQKAWGQTVVIDNRPGAGGAIATQALAKAAPDGHTLMLAFTGHLTTPLLNSKAGYDPIKDVTPITLLVNAGAVLAFHPSLPIKTWDDFMQYAKKRQSGINIGNSGTGSSTHIYAEMIREATGLTVQHIPYKGETAMHSELVAGTLEFGLMSIGPYLRLAQAGKLRAVATTLKTPLLPGMPAFSDVGVPGPGLVRGWFGVLGPAGMPANVAQQISARVQQYIRQPDVVAKLQNEWAFVPVGAGPEEFSRTMRAEYVEWSRVIKAYNVETV